MARLEINPAYRDWLARHGLERPADFLQLSGVICCGHPNRNVAQITLGDDIPMSLFLKKEHRIRWKDRLRQPGWLSQSLREAEMLRAARDAGIGCPEVIAAGEDGGRAFLLVREIPAAVELRECLHGRADGVSIHKLASQLATALGEAIARLHQRGFVHGDLFSKHILVDAEGSCYFLDWQRARQFKTVRWEQRVRDLASLDATIADETCGRRARLAFLRTYLRAMGDSRPLVEAAREVRRASDALLRKRYIRELRHTSLNAARQNLIWLKGEAFCITKEFLATLGDGAPALQATIARKFAQTPVRGHGKTVLDLETPFTQGAGILTCSRESRFWFWLWRCLSRRSFSSRELTHAATLFRLDRFGVPTPRVLAVGQQFTRPWRADSFLLTACPVTARLHDENTCNDAARLLEQVEAAGYELRPGATLEDTFSVRTDGQRPSVMLTNVAALRRLPRHRLRGWLQWPGKRWSLFPERLLTE